MTSAHHRHRPHPTKRQRKRQQNLEFIREMCSILNLGLKEVMEMNSDAATPEEATDLELWAIRAFLNSKLAEKDRAVIAKQEKMSEAEQKTYLEDMLR